MVKTFRKKGWKKCLHSVFQNREYSSMVDVRPYKLIPNRSSIRSHSDLFGAFASGLCMIHCLITPLIFIAHATTANCADLGPFWWKMIDWSFLLISFVAIYFTAKFTISKWIPCALYISWVLLAILLINEAAQFFSLPHAVLYVPALGLTVLHLYNRKYCRCSEEECCLPG